jgi:hypothetical protein
MLRPSSAFVRFPRTLRLVCFVLSMVVAMALLLNLDSWSQTSQAAPTQKKSKAAPAKVAPAKGPDWCKNAAPVVGGVATVTISVAGGNLKVDYDRVCINTTEKIEWKWSGTPEPTWSVEFATGANPFKPKNHFNHGSPNSGPPTGPANPHLIYKYTIKATGYTDLDPDVIIR